LAKPIDILRPWLGLNNVKLRGHRFYLAVADNVATKLQFLYSENAFLRFSIQLLASQPLQHLLKVFEVLVETIGEDQDVIQVYQDAFTKQPSQRLIHHRLKRC
jgi:hypothetical protein